MNVMYSEGFLYILKFCEEEGDEIIIYCEMRLGFSCSHDMHL